MAAAALPCLPPSRGGAAGAGIICGSGEGLGAIGAAGDSSGCTIPALGSRQRGLAAASAKSRVSWGEPVRQELRGVLCHGGDDTGAGAMQE